MSSYSHIAGTAVCHSWYLDTKLKPTPSVDSITSKILTASSEITQICLTLGVPTKVLAMNFMKYTERVHVTVSTENFLFYLRTWADLDLRITRNVEEEKKEILLKKFQNAEKERIGKIITRNCCGKIEEDKPMKNPAPVKREWVSLGPHEKFLQMKKEAEEEFEKKFAVNS